MTPQAIDESMSGQTSVTKRSGAALEPIHHDRGLIAIAIFKLLKSAFFFCMGMGAFHLLHKDLGDEAMRLATALRFDPEGRFVSLLLEKVDAIDAHRLREIGWATFAYSIIALTEGLGLMYEQVWAEYLTLGLTVAFIPWELFELFRDPNVGRVLLLLANLIVLCYLVWLLRVKRKSFEG